MQSKANRKIAGIISSCRCWRPTAGQKCFRAIVSVAPVLANYVPVLYPKLKREGKNSTKMEIPGLRLAVGGSTAALVRQVITDS